MSDPENQDLSPIQEDPSLRRWAAKIVHDLNNVHGSLSGSISLARRFLDRGDITTVQTLLEEAGRPLEKLAGVTKRVERATNAPPGADPAPTPRAADRPTTPFPAAPRPAPAPVAPAPAARGPEQVIILDDNEDILTVAEQMLAILGYQPVLTRTVDEAVKAARQARETGAVLRAAIVDLELAGGSSGEEAIGQIAALVPDAVLIRSSGYSSHDPGPRGPFLAKPYTIEDLESLLQGLFPGSAA